MVSVIIPALNAAKTLPQQLEALAQQHNPPPFEVIVCDNGSSDATISIARRFRLHIPQLQVVDAGARRGASHARNVGIAHATGRVVAFCDADDVVAADWVSIMAATVGPGHMVTGWLEFGLLNRGRATSPEKDLVVVSGHLPGIASGNVALTAADARRIGGFDESFRYAVEDIDFAWRAQHAGMTVSREAAVVHCRTRSTLRALFHQHRTWGRGNIMLRVRHAEHLGRVMSFRYSTKALARTTVSIIRHWRGAAMEQRRELVRGFALSLGEFEGHVMFRLLRRMPEPVLLDSPVISRGDHVA